MIAAPLALALEARFGFRYAFVGTAIAGTVWIPFWLFATRGNRIPPAEPDALPASASGVVSWAPPAPARWIDVVSSAPVLRAVVAILGTAPGLMFVINFTSQYLVEQWNLPRSSIAGYLVLPLAFFDAGALGFGWLASRTDVTPAHEAPRTPTKLLLAATSLSACLALAPLAPSPEVAIALFGAAAAGGGGVYVLVTADTLSRVAASRTSATGGMTAAAQSLAHIIAGPLVGLAIDRSHDGKSYDVALACLGLVTVPASLAYLLWPSLRKRAPANDRTATDEAAR
jgi:MFS family permease